MLTKIIENSEQLRAGQLGALLALQGHFIGIHRDACAQIHLPTGYGKTLVMLLAHHMFGANGRTMVVCASDVLREQLAANFKAFYDGNAIAPSSGVHARGIVGSPNAGTGVGPLVHLKKGLSAASAPPKSTKVIVSLPNSLVGPNRKARKTEIAVRESVRLILVDEGHHVPASTWTTVLQEHPNAKVILFTATPYRRDREPLPGRLVFSYSLVDAINEKAISDTQIHRLKALSSKASLADQESGDKAIAKKSLSLLRQAKGAEAALLVKCADTARAQSLAQLYQSEVGKSEAGSVLLLHSRLSAKEKTRAQVRLQSRDYKVVVSVEMLAEGFDEPNICVLALHDRISDLAHFIQVSGRTTRSRENASHLVTLDNMLPPQLDQVSDGSTFRELGEIFKKHLDAEELRGELRAALDRGFVPTSLLTDAINELEVPKHAICYRVEGKTSIPSFSGTKLGNAEVIGRYEEMLPGGKLWIAALRTKVRERWLGSLDVPSFATGLLLTYEPEVNAKVKERLLFVATSHEHRQAANELVESLSVAHRLAPVALSSLKGAFSMHKRVTYYNIGLRTRMPSPLVERYRTITGSEVERALDAEGERSFSQGHIIGKLYNQTSAGIDVTSVLGVSGRGAIWAAGSDSPRDLCNHWLQELAQRITSGEKPFNTALERIPASRTIDFSKLQKGAGLLGVWGQYTTTQRVKVLGKSPVSWTMTLADALIEDVYTSPADRQITFHLKGQGRTSDGKNVAVDELVRFVEGAEQFSAASSLSVEDDDNIISLAQFLREDPPLLFLGDGATVQGLQYVSPPQGMDGAALAGSLFIANWDDCDVKEEKPPGFESDKKKKAPGAPKQTKVVDYDPANDPKRSIFSLVANELNALVSDKVLEFAACDDDPWEMADFVACRKNSTSEVTIQFYLCKRTTDKKPGVRTKDIAELWAQALRTAQILTPESLRERFETRQFKRMRMKPGPTESKNLAQTYLAPGVRASFEVILVQPGVDVAQLANTKPVSPGAVTALHHAFISMAAQFQRRGVRLLVVGTDGSLKKSANSQFLDVFQRLR